MELKRTHFLTLPMTSTLLLISSTSFAANNLDITVGADAEYHSNAALVSRNTESDIDQMARLGVDFNDPDGDLLVGLGYLAERHNYLDDVEEDRTVLNGHADLEWLVAPRRFDITLSHQVSDERRNNQLADTTSNRERRSIITASANAYAHFSSTDVVTLTPRYADVTLETTSGSDSEHTGVALAWEHLLGPVSALTLSGYGEQVRFDDSINDYNYTTTMLSYKTRLSRLSYSFGGGFNAIDREQGQDVDGYTVQATADYLADAFTWGGSLLRQLTDSAIGLSGAELSIPGFDAADGNTDEFDIVESTQAELHAVRQLSEAHEVSGGVRWLRSDYMDTPRDQKSYAFSLGYAYAINRAWRLGVNADFEHIDYLDSVDESWQKDSNFDVYIAYKQSQRLSAQFGIGREKRDSELSSSRYTDDTAILSVTYLLY